VSGQAERTGDVYGLFGLDGLGRVRLTEFFTAPTLAAARRHADGRLESFAGIEVWSGPVCIYRHKMRRVPRASRQEES